jgi:hypothetical protein
VDVDWATATPTARRVLSSRLKFASQILVQMVQCDKITRKEKEDSW